MTSVLLWLDGIGAVLCVCGWWALKLHYRRGRPPLHLEEDA